MERLTATKSTVVGHDMAEVIPQSSKSWIRQPHLVALNLRIGVVLLSSTTLGFDGSMMNGLQSLSVWRDYFGDPSAETLGLMNAVLPLGILLGALPGAYISDRYGRRPTISIGSFILICAAIMQGCAHNVATFIVARFVVGLGLEFAAVPAPVLITELAYPTHRGKATSLYQTCFYVGAIASSWTTFGTYHIADSTWAWRIPSILQALFPLIQLVTIWSVPESPRWLVGKGKVEEARAFVTRYHAAGDSSAPIVAYEMNEMASHIQNEAETVGLGWSSLWKTKSDVKRLAIALFVPVISQWAGNGIITYYLSLVLNSVGITDSFHQTLVNGILQIFNMFAAVLGAVMVDRVGRRTLFLVSLSGMLWTFVVLTACSATFAHTQSSALGVVVIVFLFIYFFYYDIAMTPLSFAYPAEIMPFHSRQKAMALVNIANGLLLLFNAYANPIALEAIAWKYYIVYIVLLAIFFVVVFLYFPETRGHSLEAISELFEGPALVWKHKKSNAATQEAENGQANKDGVSAHVEELQMKE